MSDLTGVLGAGFVRGLIDENPATEAYRQGQKSDLARAAAGQKLDEGDFDLNEKRLLQPSKLQTARARASSASTNASVASRTADFRVEGARTKLASDQEELKQEKLKGFYKSIDLAIKGETESAKAIAKANGFDVPDAVLQDTELMTGIKNGALYADKLYSGRPDLQQKYMRSYTPYLLGRKSTGQSLADPSLPSMFEDQPTAPEYAGRSTSSTRRPASREEVWKQTYQSSFKANAGDREAASRDAKAALDEHDSLFSGNVAVEPKAAPQQAPQQPPAQAPADLSIRQPSQAPTDRPATLTGLGTKASPLIPRSQADVEWFKKYAHPGMVIKLNNEDYTK